MPWQTFVRFFFACLICLVNVTNGAESDSHQNDGTGQEREVVKRLMDMELESLAQQQVIVTSVSKKQERLKQVASAVYVINEEDIRRMAARSVPEALRMVPGMEVSRIDANKWAVTVRGFSGEFSNKLLVLINGRSVYTPLFAGVYWDVQDLPMANIERIEVIRGPGASIWGANAVNGVINVITKSAFQMMGANVSAHVGQEQQSLDLNYGWGGHGNTAATLWARSRNVTDRAWPGGGRANDDWHLNKVGFRVDHEGDSAQRYMLEGEWYEGDLSETNRVATMQPPFSALRHQSFEVGGGHMLGRWERDIGETDGVSVQVYYDRTERERPELLLHEHETIDIELNHEWHWSPNAELIWGLGYRHTRDELGDTALVKFAPDSRQDNLFQWFGQQSWHFLDRQLRLTLGAKLSDNGYSGFEVQPTLRTAFHLNPTTTIWSAVSRAVRTPTRAEHDVSLAVAFFPNQQFPGLALNEVRLQGDESFDAESMVSFEVGFRREVTETINVDVAAYYNEYDDLIGLSIGQPNIELNVTPPRVVIPMLFVNVSEAKTYGLEISADAVLHDNWRLFSSYSYLELDDTSHNASENDVGLPGFETQSPRHQIKLRSNWNIAQNWELDGLLHYRDAIPAFDLGASWRFDLRLGWRPTQRTELSVGGKNLLEERQQQFGRSLFAMPSEVERTFYIDFTHRF